MTDQQAQPEQPSAGFPSEPEWPAEPDSDIPLVGCTVAYPAELPAAKVLRDSFLQQHPGASFTTVLLDRPGSEHADQDAVTPEELGWDPAEVADLAMLCTADQLRAVLRLRLVHQLLSAGNAVLSFEPWVQVFGSLDELLDSLSPQRPLGLVPRLLGPLPTDGLRPSVADLAAAGPVDPAMLVLRPEAAQLVATWAAQSSSDPAAAGLETATALIDHQLIRNPGVGLSVWNAAQRELAVAEDGTWLADGELLRSVHFTGFQPNRPWLLSAEFSDRPRVLLSANPHLAGLCAAYHNALVNAGYTRPQPHPFDELPEGYAIPGSLRQQYRSAWLDGAAPRSPFRPDSSSEEFLDWACTPADDRQRAAGASRWSAAIWADDPELQQRFPDPFGTDAEAFRDWCTNVAVANGQLPAGAVRGQPEHQPALVDQLGVSVVGEGLLAELVRVAVQASGLPSADEPHYPVVLRCTPGAPVPPDRHLIDVCPEAADAEAAETWVLPGSDATRVGRGRPVRVVDLPVLQRDPVDLPERKGARARYGLSEEFVVVTFADHSDEHSTNTIGVVNAFLAAFPEREDARLLIGTAGHNPEAAERLRLATAADPRVRLVEDDYDPMALVAAADCVVVLNRGTGSERAVLRLMDVAVRGVPVLTSDRGAAAALLGSAGVTLVPCQGAGEPDAEAAARELRALAEDPQRTAETAAAVREHLLTSRTADRTGQQLRQHVERAYRAWRTKWSRKRHGKSDDPLHPLLIARHALHRTPDVSSPGRSALSPALRKAVLKVLGHYDEHIRDLLRSVIDGVEQTAAELLSRQADLDGGSLHWVRRELDQLAQRDEQLAAQLTAVDDGVLRTRVELADQHRKLQALESGAGEEHAVEELAARLDTLTGAVERIVDRLDALEQRRSTDDVLTDGLRLVSRNVEDVLWRTEALQRVLLREHESADEEQATAPVLCDAGVLQLPAEDTRMLPWLSAHPYWEREVSELIDLLLTEDGIFLDVGAYVGYQTVRVLNRLGADGAVVAVEPCARSRELLHRNVVTNVPEVKRERLLVVPEAAWDDDVELSGTPSEEGGISVEPVVPGAEGAVLRGRRLDRVLAEQERLRDRKLSVVRVDAGACVHRVLGGLSELLLRDRPSVVCTFTPDAIGRLGDDPAAALQEFDAWGYDLVPVGRERSVEAFALLEAIKATGGASTVQLWLRPRE